jgi:two-component system, OmpR family, sensor kinase
VRHLSLTGRLLATLLALLAAALLSIGTLLFAAVRNFGDEQAGRLLLSQLSLVAQAAESSDISSTDSGSTDSSTASSAAARAYVTYQALAGAALGAATWGVLVLPYATPDCPDAVGRPSPNCYTDNADHPQPPATVLARARASGQASWQNLKLLALPGGSVVGLAVRAGEGAALAAGVLRAYSLIALGALLLAGLAAWRLLRLGMLPLRRMARQAERLGARTVSAADLSERLEVPLARDEVASLARSLNRMLGRLQDAFTRLSQEEERTRAFAADASHELRTPLAAIQGSLDVLERSELNFEQHPQQSEDTRWRLLANLKREAQRAARLVDDLLTLTKLDAGEPLERASLRLDELVGSVVERAADLALDAHFTADLAPLTLSLDAGRIEGALWNLLRNAAAHTPANREIQVRLVQDGLDARLSVINPARLPPEFLARMFERFARGPEAQRRPEGSGLGLAIVRATVLAHGGEVFAVQRGELLEIGFTLPIDAKVPHSANVQRSS